MSLKSSLRSLGDTAIVRIFMSLANIIRIEAVINLIVLITLFINKKKVAGVGFEPTAFGI